MADTDRALCIVRDGRDALVSWARLRAEATGRAVGDELRRIVTEPRDRGPGFWDSGSWGTNVLSWLAPGSATGAHHVLLFDRFVADPASQLRAAMGVVAPEVPAVERASIPTFEELHRLDAGFFRAGRPGSHRTELPDELEEAFWARADNRRAMAELARRFPEVRP